jgi:hypothetical protein
MLDGTPFEIIVDLLLITFIYDMIDPYVWVLI